MTTSPDARNNAHEPRNRVDFDALEQEHAVLFARVKRLRAALALAEDQLMAFYERNIERQRADKAQEKR